MARRTDLSSTSRIFSRRPSRTSRIFSALLLTLSLLATLTGLGTAVYLERARDAETSSVAAEATSPMAAAPIVPATVVAANEARDPMAASAAIPAPPSIEPRAGAAAPTASPTRSAESPERRAAASSPTTVAPPSSQVARLEATPEAPARVVTLSPAATVDTHEPVPPVATTAATPYWVEYGVYTNARAAKRLQQALADQGLTTVIAPTHTPDGRPLLRVRSAPELDYGTAKAVSENARQALKLATLIHRGTPAREQDAAPAAVAQVSAPAASQSYWVQFGAFPHRPQAERLQEQLARGGIETTVSTMRGTSGRPLYWVRSLNLPDRDSALAVAGRGQGAGSADYLVGQSVARPGAAEPNRTENDVVKPGARYHTAESSSLPFPAR